MRRRDLPHLRACFGRKRRLKYLGRHSLPRTGQSHSFHFHQPRKLMIRRLIPAHAWMLFQRCPSVANAKSIIVCPKSDGSHPCQQSASKPNIRSQLLL